MIIKHTEFNDSKLVQLFNRLLTSRYFKLFVFLFIILSLSFSLWSANRSYKLTTYFYFAKSILSNNVKIIPNYYSSLFSNPEIIYIDMKSIQSQKLAFLRNQAITAGVPYIKEEFKEESTRGKITYKGKMSNASFSLTGQNMGHISQPYKWSFRVKLKGGSRIDGLEKLTLLVPYTRGANIISEFLGHKLMRYVGLISLRYDYKKVIFNGKDYGVYAVEEHLNKNTLENNMLREGLIIKATQNSFKVFKRDDMLANERFSKQLEYLKKTWQSFLNEEFPTNHLFNIEKLAKYYALSDIINGQHTHYLGNEFFYFNPITMLLEPIGREWDSPYSSDKDFDILFRNISILRSDLPSEKFQNLIFRDQEFVFLYFDALDKYAKKDFLEAFKKYHKTQIDRSKAILYSEYPYLDADENLLLEKIENISKALAIDKPNSIRASKTIGTKNKLIISIENTSSTPGVLETIVLENVAREIDMIIPSSSIKFLQFDVPISSNSKVFVKARLAGQRNLETIVAELAKLDVKEEDVITIKSKDIVAPKSLWVISSDILIRKNERLIVSKGTTIDMINGAGITSYGNVIFEGSAEEPITIKSSDGTGVGIAVLSAKERSLIRHTNISGLSTSQENLRILTSPVFFYESDVDIVNCIFNKNISEDGLNLFRSNFSIKNSLFSNSLSDAFDSDFSVGEIVNTSFKNSGNDAIDLSGSNVQLFDVNIDGASDKAISLGEKSVSTGSRILIENSNLGISSKDLSFFSYDKVKISNSEVSFSLFQKKDEFGPSTGEITEGKLVGNGTNFIVEMGSSIYFNSRLISGEHENVKDLMYGNVYGTATSN